MYKEINFDYHSIIQLEKEHLTEQITCADGAQLLFLQDCTAEEFETILSALQAEGFVLHSERCEGKVQFSVLEKSEAAVYTSFSEAEKCIRLITKEQDGYLKEQPADFKKDSETPAEESMIAPLVTQLRSPFCVYDCGMTYLIRVEDGSFVLIDSGVGEYEEADHIWELICSQHEGKDKPVIAAWFITHPHVDHFGGFVKFMDAYGDRIQLKSLLYNWALPEMTGSPDDLTQFDRVISDLGTETRIITPRTGQRFVYGDTIIDVLFACEDLYPAHIPNVNDTSLVMRMEINGRRILWLGDMQRQGTELMCRRYLPETFKSEILQVGHHGYAGGSDELHRMADPQVLLWPCPDFWYPVVRLWPENDYLIHSPNVRQIFVSGRGETVMNMTKPIPEFVPYREVGDGETIYEEDFCKKRVIDLHWSCLTGGKTNYSPAEIVLQEGACCLENTEPDTYSICEFLQPGQMALHPDFWLDIAGQQERGSEKFGLFWDYETPMTFDEKRVLWFEVPSNGAFAFSLKADRERQKAELFLYGEKIRTLPYETSGGLYFILKNARLLLHRIKVIKATRHGKENRCVIHETD